MSIEVLVVILAPFSDRPPAYVFFLRLFYSGDVSPVEPFPVLGGYEVGVNECGLDAEDPADDIFVLLLHYDIL